MGEKERERWGIGWGTLRGGGAVERERERRRGVRRCYIVSEFILELRCGGCPLSSTMCYAVRSIPML